MRPRAPARAAPALPANALALAALFSCAGLLAGCGGSALRTSGTVAGQWRGQGVPGSEIDMALSQDGAQVSGQGVSRLEAGPTRSFTVTGVVDRAALTLSLRFSDGSTLTYSGQLAGSDELDLARANQPAEKLTLRRVA